MSKLCLPAPIAFPYQWIAPGSILVGCHIFGFMLKRMIFTKEQSTFVVGGIDRLYFLLFEADGTARPTLIWKEISDKLLHEPLHSRCHASPGELGWGAVELQGVRDLVRSIPTELISCMLIAF